MKKLHLFHALQSNLCQSYKRFSSVVSSSFSEVICIASHAYESTTASQMDFNDSLTATFSGIPDTRRFEQQDYTPKFIKF
jgi:hypothetical protein